jgi:hypothetical protein
MMGATCCCVCGCVCGCVSVCTCVCVCACVCADRHRCRHANMCVSCGALNGSRKDAEEVTSLSVSADTHLTSRLSELPLVCAQFRVASNRSTYSCVVACVCGSAVCVSVCSPCGDTCVSTIISNNCTNCLLLLVRCVCANVCKTGVSSATRIHTPSSLTLCANMDPTLFTSDLCVFAGCVLVACVLVGPACVVVVCVLVSVYSAHSASLMAAPSANRAVGALFAIHCVHTVINRLPTASEGLSVCVCVCVAVFVWADVCAGVCVHTDDEVVLPATTSPPGVHPTNTHPHRPCLYPLLVVTHC